MPAACIALLTAFLCLWTAAPAAQVPLRLFASNGVKAPMERLLPEAERRAGSPIEATFGTTASIRRTIAEGTAFDVAILTTEAIDELAMSGTLAAGSVVALGRSGIGVGVRAGATKPGIATADTLKQTLLRAGSVTYAGDGASRVHIERMLDLLGIAGVMKSRTILEQGSVRATARVVEGDVDLVFTLISEILPVAGIDLLGPVPAEFQSYISFAAGVGTGSGNAAAGGAVIAFLSGVEAALAFTAAGIERP